MLNKRPKLLAALLVATLMTVPPAASDTAIDASADTDYVYDELENLICQTYEKHLGRDTDKDGDPDCSDPDDDGDYLTDRYDIEYIGYNAHRTRDTDQDGLWDHLDLTPKRNEQVKIDISGTYEDKSNGDCDVDGSSMDPYIEDFDTFTTGGTYDLGTPATWREGKRTDSGYKPIALPTHTDWTAANPTKTNAFLGAQSILDWNGVNGAPTIGPSAAAPQFHFSIAFLDDDLFDNDDWIIISAGSEVGLFMFALGTVNTAVSLPTPNLVDCRAQIQHTIKSNVDGMHVGALLAYQHGDRLVTVTDAANSRPKPVM